MTALAAERDTAKRHGDYPFGFAQKGNTKIYNGSLVCADAGGYAVPAADTANYKVLGRANQTSDATATNATGSGVALADGILTVEAETGIFEFATSGGSALTVADVGKLAFVLDDQTVVRTGGTAQAIPAGIVLFADGTKAVIDTRRRTV